MIRSFKLLIAESNLGFRTEDKRQFIVLLQARESQKEHIHTEFI